MGLRIIARLTLVLLVLTASSLVSAAPALTDKFCLDCHADKSLTKTAASGKEISIFVERARLAASAHKTNTCASCHAAVTARHPDDNRPVQPVNCGLCHGKAAESYGASVHGLAVKAGRAGAATCQDCHDSHDILPATSPASPLHYSKQAATCGQCHDHAGRAEQPGHGFVRRPSHFFCL